MMKKRIKSEHYIRYVVMEILGTLDFGDFWRLRKYSLTFRILRTFLSTQNAGDAFHSIIASKSFNGF